MNQNVIRNAKGQVLYRTMNFLNEIKVYDAAGSLLGKCSKGQTRDAAGRLIANSESPGLLVK